MTRKVLFSVLVLVTSACSSNDPVTPGSTAGAAGAAITAGSPSGGSVASGGNPTSAGGANGGGGVTPAGGSANPTGGSSANGGSSQAGGGSDAGGASGGGSGGANAGAGGGGGSGGGGAAGSSSHWVGTWACAPQTVEQANLPPSPGLPGNTLRQMVHVSLGGTQLRLRLSNEYGTSPVTMSSVHVAVSKGGGAIDTATDKALSFSGMAALTLAAGKSVFSDPLDFNLTALSDLAVSIQFTTQTGNVTGHPGSRTTSFLQTGNAVSAASMASGVKAEHWYFITGLDVMADAASAAVVVLGDSITDGRGSTTDKNNRWPDILAKRLQADPATAKIGVLNMGIGGNAVLSEQLGPPAVQRFDHDVIQQSGARWLIVLEGVNDLGDGSDVTSALTAAYQTFITKAHTANMRAYGVPILPVVGSQYAVGENVRKAVNDWIRTSKAFDAVIDLDAAVRDPAAPTQLLASYDSGDHLHPSAAGYQKMGESVDLALFKP